jgi:hypothetical protein
MFSKKNSKLLDKNSNSIYKASRYLSKIANKNISVINNIPNESIDGENMSMDQFNTPNKSININPFKSDNSTKNVDIDEFLVLVNEADNTLQKLSIIVNNTIKDDDKDELIGGAESDDGDYYGDYYDEDDDNDYYDEDDSDYDEDDSDDYDDYDDDDDNDDNDDINDSYLDDKYDEIQNLDYCLYQLNSIKYLYNDPDITQQMKNYLNNKDKPGIAKGAATRAMNILRNYFEGKTDEEIIKNIPINILTDDFITYDKYHEEVKRIKSLIGIVNNEIDQRIKYINEKKALNLQLMETDDKNLKLQKENVNIKKDSNLNDYIKSKEPIINTMSKFNTQMNKILILFKGKIKPNLKSISKNDINDALEDMNILNSNFTDVYNEIDSKFHNVFGVEKFGHKKADQYLETFNSNFRKISAEIISSLKAYSTVGNYSKTPDNIASNLKEYNIGPHRVLGGMLLSNFTRYNQRYSNKNQL